MSILQTNSYFFKYIQLLKLYDWFTKLIRYDILGIKYSEPSCKSVVLSTRHMSQNTTLRFVFNTAPRSELLVYNIK